MTRQRILVVGAGPRFTSGVSYYTYFLSKHLAETHDVSVIVMRRLIPQFLYPGRARVGTDISRLRTEEFAPTFDGIDWTLIPSVPRARRFLTRQRPTVVILQWWSVANLISYTSLAALARRTDARVVVEMHEGIETAEARLPVVRSVSRMGLTRLVRRSDWCVVHSEFDCEAFATQFGFSRDRVSVVTHGPYEMANSAPRRRRSEGDPITILFFGTIRPYKGLEVLVDAFDALPRAERSWKLLVVGETWEGWTIPLEKISTSRHRDDVELVNRYVSDDEVPGLFARADLVALPYLRSSASGPLHLAMARGLPVVVTDVGGLGEAVAGYEGAVTVPAGDSDALAAGIVQAAQLVGRTFDDPHSWDHTVAAYDEIFAKIGLD